MIDWRRIQTAAQARGVVFPGFPTATGRYELVFEAGVLSWGTATQPNVPTATSGGPETAKAWLMMDVQTGVPVVKASLNVSGVADNGAGQFAAEFAGLWAGTDYVGVCFTSGSTATAAASRRAAQFDEGRSQTATSFPIVVQNANGTPADPMFVWAVFYGATAT